MFYLYILYNCAADKYYVGHSEDPRKRLEQHNAGDIKKYTGKLGSWELVAIFQAGETRGQALKIERFIKKQKNRRLIEQLVQPDFKPNRALEKLVRVPKLQDS